MELEPINTFISLLAVLISGYTYYRSEKRSDEERKINSYLPFYRRASHTIIRLNKSFVKQNYYQIGTYHEYELDDLAIDAYLFGLEEIGNELTNLIAMMILLEESDYKKVDDSIGADIKSSISNLENLIVRGVEENSIKNNPTLWRRVSDRFKKRPW